MYRNIRQSHSHGFYLSNACQRRALGWQVDTELVYAYAKTGDLGALEEFISGAQQANLQARTPSVS